MALASSPRPLATGARNLGSSGLLFGRSEGSEDGDCVEAPPNGCPWPSGLNLMHRGFPGMSSGWLNEVQMVHRGSSRKKKLLKRSPWGAI